jgi:hypothetical protein
MTRWSAVCVCVCVGVGARGAAVGLGTLQKAWDQHGLAILENQTESANARKQLADLTRGAPVAPSPPFPPASA